MSRNVSVDQMASAIAEELDKYNDLAADELKKAETGEFTIPCFDGCRRCHICGGHHDEVGRT